MKTATAKTSIFVNSATLKLALERMYGTAGHLLKIWFTLKHMGLSPGAAPIEVDTSNSTPSLQRLFSCGAPDGSFYIPFAHTPRYLTVKHDASRSIVQSTIQRWASSGSVVTCDPTEFLDISQGEGTKLQVSPGRRYPFGLGSGESGFALKDGARVSVPTTSFAVWYGRKAAIPEDADPASFLLEQMLHELRISPAEKAVIFVDDELAVGTRASPLTDDEIFTACQPFIDGKREPTVEVNEEEFSNYARRVRSMVSGLNLPAWLRTSPEDSVRELLGAGAPAILLYGPPRTGKTRVIDLIMPRDSKTRCTIQIHDGWGYDHLVEGFKPDDDGNWVWKDGPLKKAVESGNNFIVLEEINRTAISQALGEVFSLIEEVYRGEANGIVLRSGKKFSIPKNVVFLMTMNTVDKSTEDVDDALLGRVAAVEFPPRPEDLNQMLTTNGVPAGVRDRLAELFAEILRVYPLGHGYFADLKGDANNTQVIRYYKTRVRPVLVNFFGDLKRQDLAKVDNLVDEMFGKA
jgi:5-methylcytosine-specific restriction protein B